MAGYLSVTDARTLTPAGEAVVAKSFARRSELPAPAQLPDYSGTTAKANSWVSPFYNQESKATAALRGIIADGQFNAVDRHIVHIGDSKTRGSGPNTSKVYEYAYPSILRRMLGAVDGLIMAEPGGAQWDNRWTSVNMRAPYVTGQIGVVPVNGNPGPFELTFAPGFTHTGGTFWVNATAGATLTVAVDGGAGQPLAVPAGNGFHPVTPTVAGDSAHTYAISSPNGFHLTAFEPTYNGPRLKITNLGRGGSAPVDWAPGFRSDGTGLWDTLQLADDLDALVIGLGTNGTQGAVNVAALNVVYDAAAALDVPILALAPGGLGGTGGLKPLADYIPMYEALWAISDRLDIPLVDFQAIIGDWPTSTADGLLADSVHETARGYAYEAAAIRALLT